MPPACIRVRGARQHNLRSVNVDIPLNQLTVITGLSGSGKSSLAFDTLYAEGQRRYVETFSPYTRQFLERMDKPDVDSIEGIPPAIAIEQSNAVKSSRSTVGSMTEIGDYLKLLFAMAGEMECPVCSRVVRAWTGEEITREIIRQWPGRDVYLCFPVTFSIRPTLRSGLETLKQQGFVRVLVNGELMRTEDTPATDLLAPEELLVIQDRLRIDQAQASRIAEAIESALRLGHGYVRIVPREAPEGEALRFTNRAVCPFDGTEMPEPIPSLYSFNNPHGACPRCRGFGRIIEIDYERALPDRNLSIADCVVKPWTGTVSSECQKDLLRHCRERGVPTKIPFSRLPLETQEWVIQGDPKGDEPVQDELGGKRWYGVKGFFEWLESQTHKMHFRILLSRYRAYKPCIDCDGMRFQPRSLYARLESASLRQVSASTPRGTSYVPGTYDVSETHHVPASPATSWRLNIGEINRLPLSDLQLFFASLRIQAGDAPTARLCREILIRIEYLIEVGLGYLTLERTTRTLSGGEVERVNLTSCLGNSLVNTLFVLDEPSIGLHPRDTGRLARIITRLRDRGNTVVVVEHDETLMRMANHILDIGPGRGEQGGTVAFAGTPQHMLSDPGSITGRYLSGREKIETPKKRRRPTQDFALQVLGATAHNLRDIDVTIPLGIFVAVTGVSGSGKSTLVHDVLHANMLRALNMVPGDDEEAGGLRELRNSHLVREIVRVDQAPLTRTPRSNPAVYLGIYENIRALLSQTELAVSQGITASDFSFNGGAGRCTRCAGTGLERITMQFLADVFVTCPACEGKRFQSHILAIRYKGKSVADILEMTVDEAHGFFSEAPGAATSTLLITKELRDRAAITSALQWLRDVGLGYLRLGQPLSHLSGGEAQRVKLLSCLTGSPTAGKLSAEEADRKRTTTSGKSTSKERTTRLFVLDEPTTGLHFEDIRLLLKLLQRLVDQGDSLIVIEHNLDVIQAADWVIDLGPEAGTGGGWVLAEGTPEQIAEAPGSHTGLFLKERLRLKKSIRTQASTLPSRTAQAADTEDIVLVAEDSPPSSWLASSSPTTAPAEEESTRHIRIRGARHHNLRNLDVDIALDKMTVITGLSGSGKSTLAFDLLFAEGQRRYLDSLNAYARQFVMQLEKPEVDSVTGIPPAVAIEQRVTRGGLKSTVATITEIYQFIRLLFAKLGEAHDPETGEPAIRQTPEQILERISDDPATRSTPGLVLLAPLVRARKGIHTEVAKWARKKGYEVLRVDGRLVNVADFVPLNRYSEHLIDLVVGVISTKIAGPARRKLLDTALALGRGTVYTVPGGDDLQGEVRNPGARRKTGAARQAVHSIHLSCPGSGLSFDELDPRHFSFNSPHGWCASCRGYGTVLTSDLKTIASGKSTVREDDGDTEAEREIMADARVERGEADELSTCPTCNGLRLNKMALSVRLPMGSAAASARMKIGEITALSIESALSAFAAIEWTGRQGAIARDILPEVVQRLQFLNDVGLGYLTLDRSATTLSGGESQRIRLAAQLGSNLQGVLYVLDEPTIGLHPRDNERLLNSLEALRDRGNTLVIVEHDEDTMKRADRIIDLGPGAGTRGGRIIADGSWTEIARNKESVTGTLLGEPLRHPLRGERRPLAAEGASVGVAGSSAPLSRNWLSWLKIRGARAHNINGVDIDFPLGRFIALSGVSGAGKSTLMHEILRPAVEAVIEKAKKHSATKVKSDKSAEAPSTTTSRWTSIEGAERITGIYEVDQSPIGKTSRSTPATYIGVMDILRGLFAQVPLARQRGYEAGRFSFNSGHGRCESCQGNGAIKVEMNFLPPIFVKCESCKGRRYNPETLEVEYNGKSIADILEMPIDEAVTFFEAVPRMHRPLRLLAQTGLGYLTLGQRSPTLSGGEAQRIKLVAELARSLDSNEHKRLGTRGFERLHHLYLLEEPTIGLHLADVRRLLDVIHQLVDAGHTVVVIEHHLDVLAEADYLLEMGPDGGSRGGKVVAFGTPEEVAANTSAATSSYLRQMLNGAAPAPKRGKTRKADVTSSRAKTSGMRKKTGGGS
ncbi:excinuclease ABC subunit A [Verrucomicrobia bacterium LW23]|nr:excinuclease ABC subunit A [Verrucomicrobia bacterium LW23]